MYDMTIKQHNGGIHMMNTTTTPNTKIAYYNYSRPACTSDCMDCNLVCPETTKTPVYTLDTCIVSLLNSKSVLVTIDTDGSQKTRLAWAIAANMYKMNLEWDQSQVSIWMSQDTWEMIAFVLAF